MNAWPRIERDLPARLTDLAAESRPDYLDDAFFGRMAEVRQRPSWAFPERWIPMDISTRAVPAPRLPWRRLGVLALIAVLLAAASLALYVGGQQQRLPAPFGPAANGDVAYALDGDIYVGDPATGDVKAIVSGPELDVEPRWSRDGTQVVFKREIQGDGALTAQLYVVQADGSGLTLVTPEPLALTTSILGEPWAQYDFSPDGRSVLIASVIDGTPTISIAASDGSEMRHLEVGMAAYEPSFRPPNGSEILFVGRSDLNHDIMAVDTATGTVRTIVTSQTDYDVAGATWSPDGSSISYWMWGGPGSTDRVSAHNHIVSADGTGDRALPDPPEAVWNFLTAWSNDGTRLLMARGYGPFFEDVRAVIIPADGSTTGIELPYDGLIGSECCSNFQWAPDDSFILGSPTDALGASTQQVILDPETGAARTTPWTSTSDPAVQRLAP